MGRFLSLSPPDIRLHRYRASVQSDYAKHQNRQHQDADIPPFRFAPLATSSPRPPIRTLSARCLQSRRHNQYAKSSVQPSTSRPRTNFAAQNVSEGKRVRFPSSNHDFLDRDEISNSTRINYISSSRKFKYLKLIEIK